MRKAEGSRFWRLFTIVQLLLVKPRWFRDLLADLEGEGYPVAESTLGEDLAELARMGWLTPPGRGSGKPYALCLEHVPLFLPAQDSLFLRQAVELAGPPAAILSERLKAVLKRVPTPVRKRNKALVWRPHDPRPDKSRPDILLSLLGPMGEGHQFRFRYASPTRREDPVWYRATAARFVNVDGALCIVACVPDLPTRDAEGCVPVERRGSPIQREFRLDRIQEVREIGGRPAPSMRMEDLEPCRFLYLVSESFLRIWAPPQNHRLLDPADVGGLVCPAGWKVYLGESVSAFRAARWLVEKGDGVFVPDLPAPYEPAGQTGEVRQVLAEHARKIAALYAGSDPLPS
ncbi:MAG: hypothetical protein VKO64_11375 [Candidatus Sericytochromatia bacterium]|nr:hypothetical protein [Candidatus Sericytochromatia bacterium]